MLFFSVIVPCFNAEKTLRGCLNSILTQTYNNFEVVVINDGSTDKSKAILDEFVKKDQRVHAYHFRNAGVAISRTRGTSFAEGDYVIFVDSDDTIDPNLLATLETTIINNHHPDIVRYQVNLEWCETQGSSEIQLSGWSKCCYVWYGRSQAVV